VIRNLLLVTGVLALAAAPASADDPKYYQIVNADGKVLAERGESEESRTLLGTAKDDPKDEAQQWEVQKSKDHLKLVNRKTGKVADIQGASIDENTPINLYAGRDEDNDNQLWSWAGKGDERRLESKLSGLVLDINGEGKAIQVKPNDKKKSQLWKLVEIKAAKSEGKK
jgi:hypothetical protein